MREITIYVADDGKVFTDDVECERYELTEKIIKKSTLRIVDKNGNDYKDKLSDDTYNNCAKVIVPDIEALKALEKIRNFTGFYDEINQIGTWVYNEYTTDWEMEVDA